MGRDEVEAFLSHLAVAGNVAASTQNQARAQLLFLYRQLLQVGLRWAVRVALSETYGPDFHRRPSVLCECLTASVRVVPRTRRRPSPA
jgi:hypothetical protein